MCDDVFHFAASSSDFTLSSEVLSFDSETMDQRECVTVNALEDGIPEQPEVFSLILNSSPPLNVANNVIASITIFDSISKH